MNNTRWILILISVMLPLLGHARQVAYDYDADSQDSYKIYFPQFPYQSPEVYSFQRCHSVDVNEYIGSANVSIPLYTIKSHDIEIPISLSYHGGGIKVAEEASWVGLGWDLAVGGCISRVVVGNSNENISQVANRNTYRSFLSSASGEYSSLAKYNSEINSALLEDMVNGVTESHIYSANILGRSFLFFRNPDRQDSVDIIGGEPLRYKVEKVSNYWKVTDDRGYVYEFASCEHILGAPHFPIAWYLTEIVSPTGTTVYFRYTDNTSISLLPQLCEYQDVVNSSANSTSVNTAEFPYPLGIQRKLLYANSQITKPYLQSIITNEQTISFSLGGRNDIKGQSRRLDAIAVHDKYGNGLVKRISFQYGYFSADGNTTGGDYMNELNGASGFDTQKSLRLKLCSVSDGISPDASQTHHFEYDETKQMPKKTSHSIDFWGYYNGKENAVGNTHTTIPRPYTCYNNVSDGLGIKLSDMNQHNAIRLPDGNFASAGILRRVSYPTGGYVLLEHELNDYATSGSIINLSSAPILHHMVMDNNVSAAENQTHQQFTIPSGTTYRGTLKMHIVTNGNAAYCLNYLQSVNTSVNLIAVTPPMTPRYSVKIEGDHNPYKVFEYTKSIDVDLSPNTYVFSCTLPSNIPANSGNYIIGELTAYPIQTNSSLVNRFVCAGGLRIKSVKEYDSDNRLLSQTDYEYKNTDGTSSGILLLPESFAERKGVISFKSQDQSIHHDGSHVTIQGTYYDYTRYGISSGIPAITSIMAPSTVGYSRVVKRHHGDGQPTVITTFINQAPSKKTRKHYFFSSVSNGKPLQQVITDASGDTLRKTDYSYSYKVPATYRCNIAYEDIAVSTGNTDIGFNVGITGKKSNLIEVYPYKLGWSQLISVTTTDYYQDGSNMTTRHSYEYNDRLFAVSKETESSSITNNSYVTEFLYLGDLDDERTKGARQRNQLMQLVQQSLSLKEGGATRLLKSKKNNYWYFNRNDSWLPVSEEFSQRGGLESRLTYSYDECCNIREIIKDNTEKTVYLWSYKNNYPVLRIEGATFSEVQNRLSSNTIKTLGACSTEADIISQTESICRNLQNMGVLVTTYLYKPLFGISKIIAPNGQVTSYEYDSLGRLSAIRNHDGTVKEQYIYHNKN